jgi:hypothetical protein
MGEYTDVALTTDEAHAVDHVEHKLSYEDLYGSTPSMEEVENPPEEAAQPPAPDPTPDTGDAQEQTQEVEYQPPPEVPEEPVAESEETTEYIPPST